MRTGGDSALLFGYDPFNLDPFIFGTVSSDGRENQKRLSLMKGKRRMKHDRAFILELGKMMQRKNDDVVRSMATKKCSFKLYD